VGGMATFTTADYLRLTDNARFNAVPNAGADALLSVAPVAAFGFLGANPGAITVEGGRLSIANGQGIALVGGNITVQGGTPEDGTTVQPAQLSAPGGRIHLASAASPGEFLAGTLDHAPNINGQSFGALGTIQVSQKSVIDASGNGGGTVLIRGGRLVVDDSRISANITGPGVGDPGKGIDIVVSQDAVIKNGAVLETNVVGNADPNIKYGGVHVKADRIEIVGALPTDLPADPDAPPPFTGVRSDVAEGSMGGGRGDINLEANSILVKDFGTFSTIVEATTGGVGDAGNIVLRSTNNLQIEGTIFSASFPVDPESMPGDAGNIELTSTHGNILMTNADVSSQAFNSNAGSITVSAPGGDLFLAPNAATLFTRIAGTGGTGGSGEIQITANNLQIIGANDGSGIAGDNLSPLRPGDITVTLSNSLSLSGPYDITRTGAFF